MRKNVKTKYTMYIGLWLSTHVSFINQFSKFKHDEKSQKNIRLNFETV